MPRALIIYLLVAATGFYLIVRFFRARVLLNLLVGSALILAPGLLVFGKLLTGTIASTLVKVGLAIAAAVVFSVFAYLTALTMNAALSQKEKEGSNPTLGDLLFYAVGVILITVFAITYVR
ncbi:MAG: hypothetical protein M1548_00890 [Actinobacteria bacterium]|nr:hypothetical protein [Actinomycetota bacterium]